MNGPRHPDGSSRWWGWQGTQDPPPTLGSRRLAMLAGALDGLDRWQRPVSPREVELPAAVEIGSGFGRELGSVAHDDSHEARLLHAVGKSYPDLARIRGRRLENAPDLVVRPSDRDQVAAVLAWAAANAVAVVPFGGGTSVVGGIEALRGGCEAVVSLDLGALDTVEVDLKSLRAQLGAGLRGPQADAALAAHDLTLGHFPQSHQQATIGGYAATRSAGQGSTGYGRFDSIVAGLEMATTAGRSLTVRHAHTAAGPGLGELALGSEGALGVITDVDVRVRRRPEHQRYEGWMMPSFGSGSDAVRQLLQADAVPEVVRLSDLAETAISVGSSEVGPLLRLAREGYLALRRRRAGCLLILGLEGPPEDVAVRRAAIATILRGRGGAYLGQSPGRSWERGRFDGPYHRDELMDLGVMVETFETATSWAGIAELYEHVRSRLVAALAANGESGLVMCHLSHAYRDGASLYFTILCPARRDAPLDQWRELKLAASEAIVSGHGTITHHHGVGIDHLAWMGQEVGEVGVEALHGLKTTFDPNGVMNPGKLIPPAR